MDRRPSPKAMLHAVGAVGTDSWRVVIAYTKRLRPQWPFLVLSFGVTVLAVINSLRSSAHQLVLPWWGWGMIALACLNVAQFLVWRGLWTDEVEPRHGQQLRTLAGEVRSELIGGGVPAYRSPGVAEWALPHAFDTHFTDVASNVERVEKEAQRMAEERGKLFEIVRATVSDQFPYDVKAAEPPRWYAGDIRKRWEHGFPGILTDVLDGIEVEPGVVRWGSGAVFDVRGSAQPARLATEAAEQLRDWIREVGGSEHATGYLRARDEKAAYAVLAAAELDPIIEHQPITKTRRCQICFPKIR